MIRIEKKEDTFIFNVEGMHKLWAFKSQLEIPIDNVKNAYQDIESIKGTWKGFRAPGTSFFSLITAGTFHKNGTKIFWDVVNIDNCIIIDLTDEEYSQLIIEVEDPIAAINILKNK